MMMMKSAKRDSVTSATKKYKQTKLGRIPVEWNVKPFSDVFEFLPTNSFSREQMNYEVSKDSIFNIHYGDIHATFPEQILDFKKHVQLVPVLQDANFKIDDDDNSLLKDGDLIIADASEDYEGLGECVELKNVEHRKVLSGLHTIAVRDRNGDTVAGFRAYLLKHPKVAIRLKKIATGSKVFGVSKSNIEELELVLPTKVEQQRIALILSTWDKAIEKIELLIAKKQQLKKGLMQQLLTGKRRFKEFVKSKKYKKTKLGQIPWDWDLKKIEDFSRVTAGATPSTTKDEYWGGNIRWMNSGELNLKTVYEVIGRITELGLKNSSTKLIPINSILIGLAGQGKTRGTVAINKVDLCTNQSIAAIVPDPKRIFHDYLFLNLDSRYDELRALSTGEGGRGGLNLEIIKNIHVAVPAIDEQLKIATSVLTLSQSIDNLKKKQNSIMLQKRGLMQKLLTGNKRVKSN